MKVTLRTSFIVAMVGLLLVPTNANALDLDEKRQIRLARVGIKGEPIHVRRPKYNLGDYNADRRLASGPNKEHAEADLEHYHSLSRRLGVDLGLMIPMSDFKNNFETAQAIGLHFIWEAIPPFAFTVGMIRASSSNKTDAANGKLSVTAINIGTQASFPMGRFSPFLKFSGGFYFNDVSFPAGTTISNGYDTLLTSVGLSGGLGFDFIVGREVSLGIDASYHYLVPKKLNLSTGATFNLGSPFALVNFRVNF